MTSHDRDFMNRIVTKIAEIDGGEITSYSGNYDFYAEVADSAGQVTTTLVQRVVAKTADQRVGPGETVQHVACGVAGDPVRKAVAKAVDRGRAEDRQVQI